MTSPAPASPTQDLSDQVLERIGALLPGIDVARYPGRPQDYRLAHPQGAVLLSYPGAQGGGARLERGGETWLNLNLGLVLINRSLWEADGVLDHLDRLRAGLHGWQPTGSLPLSFQSERLLEANGGIWWYGADYATRRFVPSCAPCNTAITPLLETLLGHLAANCTGLAIVADPAAADPLAGTTVLLSLIGDEPNLVTVSNRTRSALSVELLITSLSDAAQASARAALKTAMRSFTATGVLHQPLWQGGQLAALDEPLRQWRDRWSIPLDY